MAKYKETPQERSDRRSVVAAVAFLVLSVVVLYMPSGLQGRVAGTLRATLLRPFILTQEAVAAIRLQAEDATLLQAQLDSLASVLISRGPLAEENRRLRELLGIPDPLRRSFVSARVIRPGTEGSESMFLLDVGRRERVDAGDPVLMREGGIGLAGVIKEVRGGTAIGIDWSHPDFRASAMSADGKVFGIVAPVRGAFREADRLMLDGIPLYERLEVGTLVVTSGLGGVYPRGIPIGVVEELAEHEGRWRKAYWLRPAVRPGSLTHVLVMVGDGLAPGMQGLLLEGRIPEGDSLAAGEGGAVRPPGGEGV